MVFLLANASTGHSNHCNNSMESSALDKFDKFSPFKLLMFAFVLSCGLHSSNCIQMIILKMNIQNTRYRSATSPVSESATHRCCSVEHDRSSNRTLTGETLQYKQCVLNILALLLSRIQTLFARPYLQ